MRRDELVHVASETRDFFDQPAADVSQFFARHEKHGFQIGLQLPVHEGELEFKLEVAHGAQTTNECHGVLLAGEVDEQSLERHDAQVRDVLGRRLKHVHALLHRKKTLLGAVLGNGDDQFIEESGGTLEHVKVSVGDGIKASWVDGAAHGANVSGSRAGRKALTVWRRPGMTKVWRRVFPSRSSVL